MDSRIDGFEDILGAHGVKTFSWPQPPHVACRTSFQLLFHLPLSFWGTRNTIASSAGFVQHFVRSVHLS